MRIIGGSAAGRILRVPKGYDVRPTPDLVRQALFNSIGARVPDARVLELFGGTGALSLECLSRGAAQAVCVELSSKHGRCISTNLTSAGLDPKGLILRIQDTFQALAQLRASTLSFDLVLADPPYGEKNVNRRSESMAQKTLDNPNLPFLISKDAMFLLGHTKRDTLTVPDHWFLFKSMKHGDSIFDFFRLQSLPISSDFIPENPLRSSNSDG